MLSESKTSVLLLNRQSMVNKGSMQIEVDSRRHSVWKEQGRWKSHGPQAVRPEEGCC